MLLQLLSDHTAASGSWPYLLILPLSKVYTIGLLVSLNSGAGPSKRYSYPLAMATTGMVWEDGASRREKRRRYWGGGEKRLERRATYDSDATALPMMDYSQVSETTLSILVALRTTRLACVPSSPHLTEPSRPSSSRFIFLSSEGIQTLLSLQHELHPPSSRSSSLRNQSRLATRGLSSTCYFFSPGSLIHSLTSLAHTLATFCTSTLLFWVSRSRLPRFEFLSRSRRRVFAFQPFFFVLVSHSS